MLSTGGLGRARSGTRDLTYEQCGADPLAADNAVAIQAAWNAAALHGRWLEGGVGTYKYGSQLSRPSNLRERGSPFGTTRLEKTFTTTGSTSAGIVSADLLGAGSNNTIMHRIELGAVSYKIGAVETNKLILLRGNGIVLDRVHGKTWSGWWGTFFGDVELLYCSLEDPLVEAGVDGFHYGGGTRCVVRGCTGTASDDFIAILTPLTGDALLKDQDISNVLVENNTGVSLLARGLAIGNWDATLTADVTNFIVRNNDFKGNAVTGSVYVPSLGTTGVVSGEVSSNTIRGNTSLSAMSVRGGGSLTLTAANNVMTAGTDHVLQVLNTFNSLNFSGGSMDGTGCVSHTVNFANNAGASGLTFNVPSVICGAGRGINLASGTSVLNAPNVTATITQVPNANAGLHMNAVEDGVFTVHVSKISGATTSIGIKEGGLSARNLFQNGTLTGVDSAVSTPSGTSTYTNNAGYP